MIHPASLPFRRTTYYTAADFSDSEEAENTGERTLTEDGYPTY